jgi:hypothetical protein
MSSASDVMGWVFTSDIDHLQLAPCENVSSGWPAAPKKCSTYIDAISAMEAVVTNVKIQVMM